MAKAKTVKIDGEKFKDGDTVTVVITGKVRVNEYTWASDNRSEVFVEYGQDTEHGFYLTDAKDGKTSAKADGVVLVKN